MRNCGLSKEGKGEERRFKKGKGKVRNCGLRREGESEKLRLRESEELRSLPVKIKKTRRKVLISPTQSLLTQRAKKENREI